MPHHCRARNSSYSELPNRRLCHAFIVDSLQVSLPWLCKLPKLQQEAVISDLASLRTLAVGHRLRCPSSQQMLIQAEDWMANVICFKLAQS